MSNLAMRRPGGFGDEERLSPEEMGIFPTGEIQRILQKFCDKRGLARDSDEASCLARSFSVYYGQDVRNTDTLEKWYRTPTPWGKPPVTLH